MAKFASEVVVGDSVNVKLPVSNVSGPSTVEKVYGDGYGFVYFAVRAVNGVLYSVKLAWLEAVTVLGKAEVVTFGVKSLTVDKPEFALAA